MVYAHAQLYGHYDFNQAPMAPPGTRVVAHEKLQQRASWDPHGVDGWYLGPAPDHYRCYRVHINKTKADRIVDTVEFFPANVAMPRTASKDLATIAALELRHTLLHPAPAAPFSIIGGAQLEALRKLAAIFNAALPPSATDGSVPLVSSQPTAACAPHTPSLPRATIPLQTNPHRQPVATPTVHPPTIPSPRVDPSRAPASRVRLPHAPSPRVNTSRAPPTSARLPPAPSPRVDPRRAPAPDARLSQAPSPRLPRTRAQPPMGATPNQIQHAAAQQNDMQGTNLYGDFVDVSEGDQPPRYQTRSQIAQQSAHSVLSIPMANAFIYPMTGANMEYRGLIADKEMFPTWDRAAANECDRLAQGVGGCIEGSNNI
jgi:hypothetical protein